MIFFRNDYGEGCVPQILSLLVRANEESHPGYGKDDYCRRAAEIIQSKMVDVPCDIHFITSGTLANLTILRHLLRSYECVIAADTGHINTHETGAIEATGHKVITVPNSSGKVTPNAVRERYAEQLIQFEHMALPKVLYISNATELGTVYTRRELEELRTVCDELKMYMFMDGARIGAALMSGVDYTLNDIARWCDIFYIGGTKNGALFGEAVCISNPELKPYFRFVEKQSGAMLAKGWLLGIQFIGLFETDIFYKCAKRANELAQRIQEEVIRLGYPLYTRSTTNQVFVVLTRDQYEYLRKRVDCEIWETWNEQIVVRFVTSWHTSDEEVHYLNVYLKEASSMASEQPIIDNSDDDDDEIIEGE